MEKESGNTAAPRTETVRLGVVVERRRARSRWAEHVWRPISVFVGAGDVDGWRELTSDGERTRYHAATLELELHRAEAEDYKRNLSSPRPAIYVVMAPARGEPPWRVTRVTASPYEGEAYMAGGDNIVEPVSMPEPLAALIDAFARAHFAPTPFVKRQRDTPPAMVEERFGKAPIFERRTGAGGESSDAG